MKKILKIKDKIKLKIETSSRPFFSGWIILSEIRSKRCIDQFIFQSNFINSASQTVS